jgi:hypothetical protein
MLFSCHESKIFIRSHWNMYIINVLIKEYLKCVCVKHNMVSFNMCVRLSSILASAYAFSNMRFFSSKTKISVFSINKPTKLECVSINIYWVNQGNCALSIWCIYWMTRCLCGWIFLHYYVITFCETTMKCALVALTLASEFDFDFDLLVHFWCDIGQGVHCCLTSED